MPFAVCRAVGGVENSERRSLLGLVERTGKREEEVFCVSTKQFSGQLEVVSIPPKAFITLSVFLGGFKVGKYK
jgi:hypothetical protein